MDIEPLDPALIAQARTVIARLELVSHGGTANFGPQTGEGDPLYPPGGIARRDDREPDQPHKSHLHYRHRLGRCTTNQHLLELIADAAKTLDAWQHTPRPPSDSPAWQEQVGTAKGSIRAVAQTWGISASRVHQLRRRYADAA